MKENNYIDNLVFDRYNDKKKFGRWLLGTGAFALAVIGVFALVGKERATPKPAEQRYQIVNVAKNFDFERGLDSIRERIQTATDEAASRLGDFSQTNIGETGLVAFSNEGRGARNAGVEDGADADGVNLNLSVGAGVGGAVSGGVANGVNSNLSVGGAEIVAAGVANSNLSTGAGVAAAQNLSQISPPSAPNSNLSTNVTQPIAQKLAQTAKTPQNHSQTAVREKPQAQEPRPAVVPFALAPSENDDERTASADARVSAAVKALQQTTARSGESGAGAMAGGDSETGERTFQAQPLAMNEMINKKPAQSQSTQGRGRASDEQIARLEPRMQGGAFGAANATRNAAQIRNATRTATRGAMNSMITKNAPQTRAVTGANSNLRGSDGESIARLEPRIQGAANRTANRVQNATQTRQNSVQNATQTRQNSVQNAVKSATQTSQNVVKSAVQNATRTAAQTRNATRTATRGAMNSMITKNAPQTRATNAAPQTSANSNLAANRVLNSVKNATQTRAATGANAAQNLAQNRAISSQNSAQPRAQSAAKPAAKNATETLTPRVAKGTYIQVLSTNVVNPSSRTLTQVRRLVGGVRPHRMRVGGQVVVKFLVGPYRDDTPLGREALRTDLDKIRKNAAPGAFVYKVTQ